jgi:hypothetical protein
MALRYLTLRNAKHKHRWRVLARPPSPPMALTSMNERPQPGAFLFLFEERIVGTFHRLIRGARRWLRPCQIAAVDPAMNRITWRGQKP